MHSVSGLYFRVLCVHRSVFFFLFGLCFQSLFPDVVPLVHDLALGSTLIIAVNPFLMYMLLLLCLYCHSV